MCAMGQRATLIKNSIYASTKADCVHISNWSFTNLKFILHIYFYSINIFDIKLVIKSYISIDRDKITKPIYLNNNSIIIIINSIIIIVIIIAITITVNNFKFVDL